MRLVLLAALAAAPADGQLRPAPTGPVLRPVALALPRAGAFEPLRLAVLRPLALPARTPARASGRFAAAFDGAAPLAPLAALPLRRPEPSPLRALRRGWAERAYWAQQKAAYAPLAGLARVRAAAGTLPPAAAQALERRHEALLRTDLRNVRLGYYPRRLHFQLPVRRLLRSAPALLGDAPGIAWRMLTGRHKDLPRDLDLSGYDDEYLRQFHYQRDGWLSAHSARVYDLGVELLFSGTADVMRRQVIPPITRYLRELGNPGAELLDVGSGTGRTLLQLARTHPRLRLHGLDRSPFYVDHSREVLRGRGASLAVGDAKALPYPDARFDVVTSTFLFHELKKDSRRTALREAWRVLKPGGLLVIEDSAQLSESPELAPFFATFEALFHEPYHKGYVQDPLEDALAAQGFAVEAVEAHYLAKVVVARKP